MHQSMLKLKIMHYDLEVTFQEKEKEWIKKSAEHEKKHKLVERDSNADKSDDETGVSEHASKLPYVTENMTSSLLQDIMNDQKDTDESSSSVELSNQKFSATLS